MTAFVVESYQSVPILPDLGDAAVVLLSQILAQLQLGTNGTSLTNVDMTSNLSALSSASADVTRVNIFWFLSLILSLATVLIGIVCLQWLREHQGYGEALPPKQALGIFYIRMDALEKWCVPQIFATLPVLLQAALVLFLIGIVDFLFSLSNTIAIPVTVAVSLTIFFLFVTTVLPTLQCITVSLRKPMSNTPIPLPCAFKSPQSLVFKCFATSSRIVFVTFHQFVIYVIYIFSEIITYQFWNLLKYSSLLPPHDTSFLGSSLPILSHVARL